MNLKKGDYIVKKYTNSGNFVIAKLLDDSHSKHALCKILYYRSNNIPNPRLNILVDNDSWISEIKKIKKSEVNKYLNLLRI